MLKKRLSFILFALVCVFYLLIYPSPSTGVGNITKTFFFPNEYTFKKKYLLIDDIF